MQWMSIFSIQIDNNQQNYVWTNINERNAKQMDHNHA